MDFRPHLRRLLGRDGDFVKTNSYKRMAEATTNSITSIRNHLRVAVAGTVAAALDQQSKVRPQDMSLGGRGAIGTVIDSSGRYICGFK